MSENITNKTALITGGARRIGAHISEYLHGKGMNVLIHYRQSESEAKKLKVKLNKKRRNSAEIFQADLNNENVYKNLIEFTTDHFKRLDFLINNA